MTEEEKEIPRGAKPGGDPKQPHDHSMHPHPTARATHGVNPRVRVKLRESGAQILDEIMRYHRRHIDFTSVHAAVVSVLWEAHTHAERETFDDTPRLILEAPVMGSGKTRLLEITEFFSRNPKRHTIPTPAVIFRQVAAESRVTILIDETDTIFSKGKERGEADSKQLRALLNVGYREGGTVWRNAGDLKSMKPQEYQVYAPVAMAGITADMPVTLLDRSIIVPIKRRKRSKAKAEFKISIEKSGPNRYGTNSVRG